MVQVCQTLIWYEEIEVTILISPKPYDPKNKSDPSIPTLYIIKLLVLAF